MNLKIFRWKAIGPLLLLFAIFAVLLWLFAEPLARDTTEEASTELLGTQVDVGELDIHAGEAAVDLRRLQIAHPFVLTRNLIEAEEIRLKLNPAALAEKKLVIENLSLQGMRFDTQREEPARPPSGDGFTAQVYRAVEQWANQFDLPLLSLTPIDTIRQLVLNPDQLTTIKQAQTVLARTDSVQEVLTENFRELDVRPTIDSAQSLIERLGKTDPKALGLDGTKEAIESVRQTLRSVAAARERIETLERTTGQAVKSLGQGLELIDEATKKDVAFAKSLLKLPTFAAPEIGTALFGKVSIDRFKQAVYWAELAQKYMPPGLRPRATPGPQRLRASGATIQFPKDGEYPSFLLERGTIDFVIGGTSAVGGAYAATVQGITSAPALYGRPAIISAGREARGSATAEIDVDAVIDHVTSKTLDSAHARLRGIDLPSFDLPGIPFSIAPGRGSSELAFTMKGSELFARWAVQSDQVGWVADPSGRTLNDLERLIGRVISGLKALEVVAELRGTISSPKLSVSSNLDQAIAGRLKAAIGEEVARAEQMVRAKVDSLVADKVAPVRQRVSGVQAEANQRIAGEKQRLDQVEEALNAELKRLTRGLAPGIKLPEIKL